MREYTNPITQENTASPENTATQSLPFLVLLKKRKQKRIVFHSIDQPAFYSEDSFHTDPRISHQLEIPIH